MRIEAVRGGGFDLDTTAGRLMARQLVAIAAYESGHKSDRVKRANKRLAEQGAWHGPARYGYGPGGVLIPEQAAVIRQMADRFLAGESLRSITAWLNRSGIPPLRASTGTSGLWHPYAVRSVLSSARISGQRAYAPDTRADPAGGREILGRGDWEPIITPEETAQIRAILADPTRRRTTPARPTLLGGIARCGKCGAGLTITGKLSPTGNTQRYTCQKDASRPERGGMSINATHLDDYVTERVLHRLANPRPSSDKESTSALLGRVMEIEYPIGISPTVIAQCLDVDRIQPPRRDRWHATTVRAIFNSERLHIKRWDHVGQRQIIGSWERLLTQDESALVQVGLLMPRRDAARSSRTLLGGILRCHRCGARLVAGVTRHGKRIYTCRTATKRCPGPSVAADDLDAETEAAALDTFVNALHFDVPCAQDLLGRVRIARIKLAALAASFGAGDVDHTSFLRRRGPLVEQLDRAGHDVATHTRARILALGTTEFHRHWTRLAFRRAAVCALVSFDTPTTSPFTPGPRDPRTLKR